MKNRMPAPTPRRVTPRAATLIVAGLSTALTSPLVGQTAPTTYRACYVPDVGALYLLDLPGLPTACLSEGHEEIQWSEAAGEVDADGLLDGAVTTPKLAPSAVTTDRISDEAITSDKLADDAVTTDKIAAGAVGGAQIAVSAISSSRIADGSITSVDLGPTAVTGGNIVDGSITSADLAADAVTATQIAANAVAAAELAPNAVNTTHIAPGTITADDIGTNAVGAAEIAANAVGASELNVAYLRFVTSASVPPLSDQDVTITCPAGREVLSGGWLQPAGLLAVLDSYPASAQAWAVRLRNPTAASLPVTVLAVCADVS